MQIVDKPKVQIKRRNQKINSTVQRRVQTTQHPRVARKQTPVIQSKPKKVAANGQQVIATPNKDKHPPISRLPQQRVTRVVKTVSNRRDAAAILNRQPHRHAVQNVRGIHHRKNEPAPGSREKLEALRGVGFGKALVIMGNGPSISEVDFEPLLNIDKVDFMSINKPVQQVWPTEYWLFCDHSQMRRHKELWDRYNGWVINTTAIKQQRKRSLQIKNIKGRGFSYDLLKGFHIGRSSTYAAMQVAVWLGYDRIYIFGIDMCEVNGNLHFYGTNPDVRPDIRKSRFDHEAKYYDEAAMSMDQRLREKFVFCSAYNPYSFLKKYNAMDHTKAVGDILSWVSRKSKEEE